jgi:hypothetical protein
VVRRARGGRKAAAVESAWDCPAPSPWWPALEGAERSFWGPPIGGPPDIKSPVELRYAQPFLNRLQRESKNLRIAIERAIGQLVLPALSAARQEKLEEDIRDILENSQSRRMPQMVLASRNIDVLNVLLQGKARQRALANSGLYEAVDRIRRRNDQYQNAKDQASSQSGTLERLLRTGGIHLLWSKLNESARRAWEEANMQFGQSHSTIRRLWHLGVPASTIPKLIKLVGLPRTTIPRVRNVLARTR